jgi:hypothetical protein
MHTHHKKVWSPGRSEEVWWKPTNGVAIHKCMEAMLGISPYSYLYLKLEKNTMSFLLSLRFSLQQNQRRNQQNRFCLEADVAQCIHM